jgi:hypothetical protein
MSVSGEMSPFGDSPVFDCAAHHEFPDEQFEIAD